MAVITKGTTGCVWGLTAEVGILVQTVGAKTTIEKNEVRNEAGEFVAIAFYNPTKTYSVAGVMTGGAGGIATASVGAVLTLVNTASGNGVTTGLILTDDIDIQKTNTDWQKISVNATQRPLILA